MQELLTRKEAAGYLRMSLRTFDSLVAEGRLPKYRVSRQLVRFRREDLDSYVEGSQEEPDESVSVAVDTVMGE